MERQAPPEPPTDDAESGTRIHLRLAGDINVSLSPEEEDLAERCRVLAEGTILDVLGGEPDLLVREQRLWLPDPDTLERLCSGQFDLFARRGNDVLILDYKTGRTPVTPEDSWQLRCLVALAFENALVDAEDKLTVAIVQPWLSPQVKLVSYNLDDQWAALDAVREVAMEILKPGQPRRPSEAACLHCRAKAICPDAHKVIADTAAMVLPDGREGEVLDGKTAGWLLDRCGLAERVIGSIRSRAKHMLEVDPASIPGWKLKEGALREKIVDVAGVWAKASPLGVSPAEFTAACSLTKTNAKAMLRAVLGLKGRALDDQVAWITEGCVEAKRAAPQLVRADGNGTAITTASEEAE